MSEHERPERNNYDYVGEFGADETQTVYSVDGLERLVYEESSSLLFSSSDMDHYGTAQTPPHFFLDCDDNQAILNTASRGTDSFEAKWHENRLRSSAQYAFDVLDNSPSEKGESLEIIKERIESLEIRLALLINSENFESEHQSSIDEVQTLLKRLKPIYSERRQVLVELDTRAKAWEAVVTRAHEETRRKIDSHQRTHTTPPQEDVT